MDVRRFESSACVRGCASVGELLLLQVGGGRGERQSSGHSTAQHSTSQHSTAQQGRTDQPAAAKQPTSQPSYTRPAATRPPQPTLSSQRSPHTRLTLASHSPHTRLTLASTHTAHHEQHTTHAHAHTHTATHAAGATGCCRGHCVPLATACAAERSSAPLHLAIDCARVEPRAKIPM